jgi:MFS family permease
MSSTEEYAPPKNGFRTFVILWATQSVSVMGSQLTFFALTIWMAQVLYARPDQKAELAFALSAWALSFGIPQIFLAPIAGAWADRHDRKLTMMGADTLSGVVNLILLGLVVTGTLQLWMLLALAVVQAAANSFHYSAFDTSYAMIVPEAQLPRANGMMQTIWSLSGIVSPALAAFIVSLPGLARQGFLPEVFAGPLRGFNDGTPIAIGLDAFTFFVAAGVLAFLAVPSPKRSELAAEGAKKPSLWADIRLGATYIWHRRPLLWLLATFTVINFAGAPTEVFLPLLLKFNLAQSWQSLGFTFESAMALLASAAAVGGVAGGLFISTWGGLKRRRVYGVVVPVLLAGALQIAFGLSHLLYLSVASLLLVAGLGPIMNAHSQTIWQTQTPRELQGRVFAVRRLIAQFSSPLSVFVAGFVGGLFDPGIVLAVLGGIVVLFCIFQLFNPQLLRIEDKAYLEELAAAAAAKAAAGEVPSAPATQNNTPGGIPGAQPDKSSQPERSYVP